MDPQYIYIVRAGWWGGGGIYIYIYIYIYTNKTSMYDKTCSYGYGNGYYCPLCPL